MINLDGQDKARGLELFDTNIRCPLPISFKKIFFWLIILDAKSAFFFSAKDSLVTLDLTTF